MRISRFGESRTFGAWSSTSLRLITVWLIAPILSRCYIPRKCNTSSFSSAGSERGPAAAASDGLSHERLFCTRRPDGTVRTAGNRTEVAAGLGGGARLLRPQSRARSRARRGEDLRARDAAVPVGGAPRGPCAQLHARRGRLALSPPPRLSRPAPDGLRRLRPPGRERGDQGGRPPAGGDGAKHRLDPRADEAA